MQTDVYQDSDDVITRLIAKHGLEEQMKDARTWVAEEFYAPEAPNLAYLRLRCGLTQEQLAVKLGIPQSSVSRLERGLETPSLERAKKMADALGVTLDAYFNAHMTAKKSRATA